MVTKQSVIMHRGVTTSAYMEHFQETLDEHGHPRVLVLTRRDWLDMGGPQTITVSIRPGDRLNDDPISA